jgi:hypothetical protein
MRAPFTCSRRAGGWGRDGGCTATVDLAVGGLRLSLFTTLTTLGTPTDVCASELKIEHYFPADDATEGFLRSFGE